VPGFESLSCVLAPCRNGTRVLTLEWVLPTSGESDLPFSDRPSGPIHTTNCRRTESAGAQMAGQDQSPPVQGFLSVSSSDYGSPPHLEPYSPSVVVSKQGGETLRCTSGQDESTSGGYQATAQLEDRGRFPLSSYSRPGPPYSTGPSHPTTRSTTYSSGRHTNPFTGCISHHNWSFHSCGRNIKYSSHTTNENFYTCTHNR